MKSKSITTTERTRRLLASLPDSPGIYVFRDAGGKVLYVGKAKSLRKRVMSYFRKGGPVEDNLRIARMLKRMHDFDFVVTASETEALLLESNFIKHHRPPFNVMLRDDKSYPYVAITLNEKFPRVMITRKPHRPGVAYFGPFAERRQGARDHRTAGQDLSRTASAADRNRAGAPARPVSTITSASAWRPVTAKSTQ